MQDLPILYSFRRCPYAMRARMALIEADFSIIVREIDLKNKAEAFLTQSPKGTVPALLLPDGRLIDESLAILDYVHEQQNKKNRWLENESQQRQYKLWLQDLHDTFIPALNIYKYPDRYPDSNSASAQAIATDFLQRLNLALEETYLFGSQLTRVDIALLPFIRQFSLVDPDFLIHLGLNNLNDWLESIIQSKNFANIMQKHPLWSPGQTPCIIEP